ncbi:MAG TPA: xanthine dehydrogenase family protein molybdopterin-binding subunit [Thermoanaerobaculia bacterium]|nr:xanthine dehydrogenase family protein molybdopterin-binding subunit [Thermoanaerobaculia bacterium]
MNRREFLQVSSAASAGLIVGLSFPAHAHSAGALSDLGAFIQIAKDNTVTLWVSKSDMGQDVRTTLPMILAEELDADWANVRIQQAHFDPKFGRQGTGGSSSIRTLWTPLRQAGANARAMLVSAAAAKLGVDAATLTVERGVISAANGAKVTFGEVAEEASRIKLAADAKPKEPSQFKLIGKATKRLDNGDIVTGKAGYGIDVKVPGMLYASVARAPVFGAKVKRVDAAKAKAVSGVKDVVQIAAKGTDLPWNGVAVVATSTWAAMKGREALAIEWEEGEHASESEEALRKQFAEIVDHGKPVTTRGDVSVIANATKKVEAQYDVPFLAHAAMEPLNAVAHVKSDGTAVVWTGTQFPDWIARSSAELLGTKPEQVQVHVTMLGGGFGRRANPDFALEAVQLSKAVGAPVKVQWTREDDMQHDFYRPASLHRISAALDDEGNVTAWHHRIAAASIDAYLEPGTQTPHESETPGVHDMPYDVPNFRTDFAAASSGVPRGWWRSVEHSINGFVMNSFLDELAHAGGKDPIALRLELLPKGFVQKAEGERNPARLWPFKSDRLRAVIELARDRSGWGKPLAAGRALGFAAHHSFFSYAAQVAEVSLDASGHPKVHKIVCVIDCGVPINPDGIRAQIEGGIVYGLAAGLGQKITMEAGRVQQSNFHDFPLLALPDMPQIEVHIVPSAEAPTGTGEPGLPPTMAAVTNAMFRLNGKRVRSLPVG